MPALIHPTWPKLSRRLLVTAGIFFIAFVLVIVFLVFMLVSFSRMRRDHK